jgi:hypothetical protein
MKQKSLYLSIKAFVLKAGITFGESQYQHVEKSKTVKRSFFVSLRESKQALLTSETKKTKTFVLAFHLD